MKILAWGRKNLKLATLTLGIIAITGLVVWYIASPDVPPGQKDLNSVKSSVSKLMLLPTNEQPLLASVEDKTKLKDQFLAAKAENGDKLLIYIENGIAILYRPSINKIVAVSPVSINLAIAESSGATLTILNGTGDSNQLSVIENKIKAAYPALTIKTGNANRNDFTTTIVIDNTKTKSELVTGLMNAINGKKGVVPLGETTASTDLEIIIGKDSL